MVGSARREQLLEVTTAMVADRDFRAVSVKAVAANAGISRAVIYEHFGDLQGLLTAVVEREMERALAQVSATELTTLTKGSPQELMIESLHAYLHTVRDNPTTWRLVLMPPEGAPELLRKSIERGRAAVLARLTEAVRPALTQDRGSPDAELSARMLSAMADEYARLVLTDPERYTPDRLLVHARWWIEQLPL